MQNIQNKTDRHLKYKIYYAILTLLFEDINILEIYKVIFDGNIRHVQHSEEWKFFFLIVKIFFVQQIYQRVLNLLDA